MSSQSKRHALDDTSSSKKSRGRDDPEVSSPIKKSKNENTGKKKIGAEQNKKCEDEYDEFVIPYLAELARQGFIFDKIFKAFAFPMAVCAVNMKFGMNLGGPNVANYMKSLRT